MIEIGLKHTSELTVTDTVTAIQMGSGDMPVLATPAMMALMENAAMLAVADELPEGSLRAKRTSSSGTTVGGHIESSHLKTSSQPTIRAGLSMANSLTAVVVVCLWLVACVTSSRAGSSPSNRCTSVTSGRFTSLLKWATENSPSLASPVARRLSLKLNS